MDLEKLRKLAGREVTLTVRIRGVLGVPSKFPGEVSLTTQKGKFPQWFRAEDIAGADPGVPENWPPMLGDVWQHKQWHTMYLAGQTTIPGNFVLFPNRMSCTPLPWSRFEGEHPINDATDFELLTPGQAREDLWENEERKRAER